jgi:hypothetical protein
MIEDLEKRVFCNEPFFQKEGNVGISVPSVPSVPSAPPPTAGLPPPMVSTKPDDTMYARCALQPRVGAVQFLAAFTADRRAVLNFFANTVFLW